MKFTYYKTCSKNTMTLPFSTSLGLKPFLHALGAPQPVLVITLWYGWYQKSYPNSTLFFSQFFFTSNVSPSNNTNPPGNMVHSFINPPLTHILYTNTTHVPQCCTKTSRHKSNIYNNQPRNIYHTTISNLYHIVGHNLLQIPHSSTTNVFNMYLA